MVQQFLPAPQNANSYLAPYIPKTNYQQLPPQPQTNQDQTLLSPCMVDVSCLGQTAFKCWTQFTTAASTGALVLNSYGAMWLNATNIVPILGRTTTGIFTITWPTLVSHEYTANLSPPVLDNIAVNLSKVWVSIATFGSVVCFVGGTASGNVITLNVLNTSSSAIDNVGTVINVGAL